MRTKRLTILILLVIGILLTSTGISGCNQHDPEAAQKDLQAPVLRTQPADVRTEVGLYDGIPDDLAGLDIVDDVTKRVDVFPLSISFDGETRELTEQISGVYLRTPGIYTIQFGMRDEAGNESNGSYRLIAESANGNPILDAPEWMIAWRKEDGTVQVPSVNVIHDIPTNVTVAVYDGDREVSAANGTFAAEEKAYSLVYTAADDQGRTAQAKVTLLVNPKGVINDFNLDGEQTLWGYETRTEDGRLYGESSADSMQIACCEYFLCGDWSGQKTLHFAMQNNKASDAVVRIEVVNRGEWTELPGFKLEGASVNSDLTDVVPVLRDYAVALNGIEKVEGIRLTVECAGGVGVAVDKIYLDDSETEMPSLTEEGFVSETFQLNGLDSWHAEITSDIPAGGKNAVRCDIVASARANVQIGLVYENGAVYARTTLEAGENNLIRVPALENKNAAGALRGIVIRSMENYPVTLQVSGLEYSTLSGIDGYSIQKESAFAFAYGDTFYTPNPICLDGRYYSNLSAALYLQGTKIRDLSVGDPLYNEKDTPETLRSGTVYELRYTYLDAVSGKVQTLSYPLVAMKHTLSFTLESSIMFRGDNAQIEITPDSEIFTQEELKNAVISGFYREQGKKTWIPFDSFVAEKSKTYEFRYVVSCGGFRCERRFERFVHLNTNTIDFEYEPAAVQGNAILYSDVESSFMDERFLFDGGYYDFKLNGYSADTGISTDWAASGTQSYRMQFNIQGWGGFYIAPAMAQEPVNAVRFWANASVGQTTQIALQTGSGWVYTDSFDILPGVHQYVVYLQSDNVTNVSAFTMQMIRGITIYFDDVEILYIDSLSMAQPEYPDVLDISEGIELMRPMLHSDIYTEDQLRAAAWKCNYAVDGGEVTELLPDADGKYILKLAKGGHLSVTWTAQVDAESVSGSTKFTAGVVPISAEMETGRLNDKVTVVAPSFGDQIDAQKCSLTVQWRRGGGDWTKIDVGQKIHLKEAGTYEIRYQADYPLSSSITISGEKTYKIIVPEENVLWHFEDSDPWNGAQPYDWNEATVTSIVEEKEDGTHWLAIYSSEHFDSWRGISAKSDAGVQLGVRTDKLLFTVTATKDTELSFWFRTNKGETYQTVNVKKGENSIEVTLNGPADVLYDFSVLMTKGHDPIYIDDICRGEASGPQPDRPAISGNMIEDFESGLPAGAEFYAPNTFPRIEKAANGSYVLAGQYSVEGLTAWHGIKNANYELGQKVNQLQFTFTQTASSPVTLTPGNIWFDTDAGSMYASEVKVEGNVYTVTFAQSFSVIKSFAIEINNDMVIVGIDDLLIPGGND